VLHRRVEEAGGVAHSHTEGVALRALGRLARARLASALSGCSAGAASALGAAESTSQGGAAVESFLDLAAASVPPEPSSLNTAGERSWGPAITIRAANK
jgi:hypothetical protein